MDAGEPLPAPPSVVCRGWRPLLLLLFNGGVLGGAAPLFGGRPALDRLRWSILCGQNLRIERCWE